MAAVSSHTYDWNKLASFLGPIGGTEMVFVTAIPEAKLGNMGFILAFHPDVWGYLSVAFVITASVMFLAMLIFTRKSGGPEAGKDLLIDAVITTWGITLDQDAGEERGTRYVSILWIAFVLVMSTGYKSNLAVFMSFPSLKVKPQNFPELDVSTEYTIYFDKSAGAAWFYFHSSDNPLIINLRKRMVPVDPTECVILAFMESKAVCTSWLVKMRPTEMKNLSATNAPTTLITSADSIWEVGYHMAIEKHSRFKDAFQFITMSSFESGLISAWIEKMMPLYRKEGLAWLESQNTSKLRDKLNTFSNEYLKKDEAKVLQVENFEYVFLIWGVGLFITVAWFSCEFCWQKHRTGLL